jgi:hypothetical protein
MYYSYTGIILAGSSPSSTTVPVLAAPCGSYVKYGSACDIYQARLLRGYRQRAAACLAICV